MKTIEQLKAELLVEKAQSEVVEMLLDAEKLRRRVNEYLQAERSTCVDEWRREKIADISEDLYTMEHQLGEVIGHNLALSITSER